MIRAQLIEHELKCRSSRRTGRGKNSQPARAPTAISGKISITRNNTAANDLLRENTLNTSSLDTCNFRPYFHHLPVDTLQKLFLFSRKGKIRVARSVLPIRVIWTPRQNKRTKFPRRDPSPRSCDAAEKDRRPSQSFPDALPRMFVLKIKYTPPVTAGSGSGRFQLFDRWPWRLMALINRLVPIIPTISPLLFIGMATTTTGFPVDLLITGSE